MRRVLPAIGLYFLAPLVAEFLLGNLVITSTMSIFLWHSFPWTPFLSAGPMLDLVSKTILAIGAVALLATAALRLKQEERISRINHDSRSVTV